MSYIHSRVVFMVAKECSDVIIDILIFAEVVALLGVFGMIVQLDSR